MQYFEINRNHAVSFKKILEDKGYKVTVNTYDYLDSATISDIAYWVEGKCDESYKSYRVGVIAAQPIEDEEDAETRIQRIAKIRTELGEIPHARFFESNRLLSLIGQIKELAPEVDLPEGWMNPLEVMAKQLSDNILEDQRGE